MVEIVWHELILSSITFLLISYLGILVLVRNIRSWTHRLFFILTLLLDLYILFNYISLNPSGMNPEQQLFWIRVVMAEASFLGPVLVLLVHTFPKNKISLPKGKVLALIGLGILSFSLSLSPYVFDSISYNNGMPVPHPNWGIVVFFVDFAGLFLLSFFLLISKYRKSKGLEKAQILYFLLGIITTFSLMTTTTLIFTVILRFTGLVFLGPVYTIFLVGFITYSIVKHRFLDIRTILNKAVTYFLLLLSLGALYSSLVIVIGSLIFIDDVGLDYLLLTAVLSFVLAFSFQPLRRFIEKSTDKFLFKGSYDFDELMQKIGNVTSSNIELGILAEELLETLVTSLKPESLGLILLDKEKVTWSKYLESEINLKEEDLLYLLDKIDLTEDTDQPILIMEEVNDESMKEVMRKSDLDLLLPLVLKDEIIGVLLFSSKKSGEIYSLDDIRLLKIVAPSIAISVKNALSYEEIKGFNIKLKKKVEQATKDLRSANQRLKQVDRQKDEFISIASHELKTPISIVKTNLWMFRHVSEKKGLNEKQNDLLREMELGLSRLADLINNLLDISRIEQGRFVIEESEEDLDEVMENSLSTMKDLAERKGLKLFFPKNKIGRVYVDKERFGEVLNNLVSNAIKYTDEGGIKINAKKVDGHVRVSVTDSGPGISEEEQKRLFKKFSRAKEGLKEQGVGASTGLGLYIVKKIVEEMGGEVGIKSKVGKGSTFWFTFPVKQLKRKNKSEKDSKLKKWQEQTKL